MKLFVAFSLFVTSFAVCAQTTAPQFTIRVAQESQPAATQAVMDTVYVLTDPALTKEPSFPGGDAALKKFVDENLKYPEGSQNQDTDIKVVFSFVVSPTGTVRQVRVTQSAGFEYDKNALHLMQMMPVWIPGEVKDKPVGVYCIEPIVFKAKVQKAAGRSKPKTKK